MNLYRKLSQIGFLKNNYAFKFLFVAFIGIHIPLIGILFFALYADRMVSPNSVLIFALIMTLFACGSTLFILKKLIRPIEVASKALNDYRTKRTISVLPTEFTDEAGLLMKNIQQSIEVNEAFIIEKQDLMYLLSHDLRTFTGNSKSLSKLILDEHPSGAIQELAELIYQSTTQQFHFIDSFIRLIKEQDEISKQVLDVKEIDLQNVALEVESQVSQQLAMKNIILVATIKITQVKLHINQDLLIRVLVNVIDNAIKFSFPGKEIILDIWIEKSKLYLKISDSGLGFDPINKEEIFKKFTNQGRLGTANETSTGIGLYLCRKIIEKHNGQLLAESKGLNQGAVFSIVFDTAD